MKENIHEFPVNEKILIITVGNDNRPASNEDIEHVCELITTAKDADLQIITHHAIQFYPQKAPEEGYHRFFQLGSEQRPASEKDIIAFQDAMESLYVHGGVFVCGHEIKITDIKIPDGAILASTSF